jgi:hypothetical protein
MRDSAAITRNTGALARNNIPPLGEWSLKIYYFYVQLTIESNYGKKEIMLRSTSIAAIGLAMRLYLLHIMYKLDIAVPERSDGTRPTGDPVWYRSLRDLA